jgi:hypothetical protein
MIQKNQLPPFSSAQHQQVVACAEPALQFAGSRMTIHLTAKSSFFGSYGEATKMFLIL